MFMHQCKPPLPPTRAMQGHEREIARNLPVRSAPVLGVMGEICFFAFQTGDSFCLLFFNCNWYLYVVLYINSPGKKGQVRKLE